jgi:hypothetical protein
MLAYAFWLVETGVFTKVKVSFLLVGHTHENIDQFFSRLSCALRNKRALTLPQMLEVVTACATPCPENHVVTEMIDFKHWLNGMQMADIYNSSKNQVFTCKRDENGQTHVMSKKYSDSPIYGEKIKMLGKIPNEVERHKVLPKAYKVVDDRTDKQKEKDLIAEAEGKEKKKLKTIPEKLRDTFNVLKAKDPVGWDQDADSWWETFIQDATSLPVEEDLPKDDKGNPIRTRVRHEWVPLLKAHITPERHQVTINDPTLTIAEVDLVRPEVEPLTTQKVSAAARKKRGADPSDMKVGDLLALKPFTSQGGIQNTERAADLVTPFWVCEVMKSHPNNSRKIQVAWYGAEVSRGENKDDWTKLRWSKRYMRHKNGRASSKVVSGWLDKYECGLLAYSFVLKKNPIGSLRADTAKLIRERLESDNTNAEIEAAMEESCDEE